MVGKEFITIAENCTKLKLDNDCKKCPIYHEDKFKCVKARDYAWRKWKDEEHRKFEQLLGRQSDIANTNRV